jgi:hypothetical protein
MIDALIWRVRLVEPVALDVRRRDRRAAEVLRQERGDHLHDVFEHATSALIEELVGMVAPLGVERPKKPTLLRTFVGSASRRSSR